MTEREATLRDILSEAMPVLRLHATEEARRNKALHDIAPKETKHRELLARAEAALKE